MQTYTTDTGNDTASNDTVTPLMLHVVPAARRRALTAGAGAKPVMRETAAPTWRPRPGSPGWRSRTNARRTTAWWTGWSTG